jgi:hypothetical protein
LSRKTFAPTKEQRDNVEVTISLGLTEAEVCQLIKNPETGLPIDEKTLRKHFSAEIKELYDKGGELALQEISRRKPVLKNRTPIEIEQAVVAVATDQPAWGQVRVSEALKRRGLSISPAGVRCVWLRHDLTSIKHRLKALEAKVAQDGILLTEAQITALEKAKADKEAHGEFESECPGYCGAQDTFYVGTLCWHPEGRRADLSADLHRHLCQGRLRQAV